MDLAQALAATAPKKGPSCSIGKFLEGRDDRAQLESALTDTNLQTAHLTRALGLIAGMKFDPQSVSRHRKGACNCEPR
jgi:hypothetical protein